MNSKPLNYCLVGVVALGSLLGSGCATKRFVKRTVSPIETRVGEEEKKTAANTKSIDELGNRVSQANERAVGAQTTADKATQDAAKANEAAMNAGTRADAAKQAADKGAARADEVDAKLNRTVENFDNYKVIATENVLFGFGKSELTPEAKAQLDAAVQNLTDKKHFILEVEGFTDKTGSPEYNLALSQRRADSVVRYLTAQHKIPLRSIYVLGYGETTDENKTSAERKASRRVEVKLLVSDLAPTKLEAGNVSPQP
jgi:outer membrane protein OmpA-like peptidoglycan-associated protein